MGQYYRAVIGDSEGLNHEVMEPRTGEGSKLMEQAWWGSPYSNAVAEKLYNNPSRVCWVGDYADDDDFINFRHHHPVYREVWGAVKPKRLNETGFSLNHKYLLNHDTKEYISLDEYREQTSESYYRTHPLPLLTAVGNDRGSGDFHEGNVGYESVGSWAWSLISIADNPTEGYSKVEIVFQEM